MIIDVLVDDDIRIIVVHCGVRIILKRSTLGHGDRFIYIPGVVRFVSQKLPSGKHTNNHGKSPFSMGKSTNYKWPFSIVFCLFTRPGISRVFCQSIFPGTISSFMGIRSDHDVSLSIWKSGNDGQYGEESLTIWLFVNTNQETRTYLLKLSPFT